MVYLDIHSIISHRGFSLICSLFFSLRLVIQYGGRLWAKGLSSLCFCCHYLFFFPCPVYIEAINHLDVHNDSCRSNEARSRLNLLLRRTNPYLRYQHCRQNTLLCWQSVQPANNFILLASSDCNHPVEGFVIRDGIHPGVLTSLADKYGRTGNRTDNESWLFLQNHRRHFVRLFF